MYLSIEYVCCLFLFSKTTHKISTAIPIREAINISNTAAATQINIVSGIFIKSVLSGGKGVGMTGSAKDDVSIEKNMIISKLHNIMVNLRPDSSDIE